MTHDPPIPDDNDDSLEAPARNSTSSIKRYAETLPPALDDASISPEAQYQPQVERIPEDDPDPLTQTRPSLGATSDRIIWTRFQSPLRALRSIALDLLDLTLPPKCVSCHKLLSNSDALICQHCYSQLGLIHHGCLRCGAPLPLVVPETEGCLRCKGRKWSFSRAVALGPYSGLLQQLVIGMKRPYHETTTMYFGKLLADRVRECRVAEQIDLIVPVPSHWLRRLTRKISTAEVLAESIALTLELPWSKKYAWRRRSTRKQGTLRAAERGDNVKAAFKARLPDKWKGSSILLVDDVLTSGATASEAAKSLLDAGAGEVIVASVARALGEHKMNQIVSNLKRDLTTPDPTH